MGSTNSFSGNGNGYSVLYSGEDVMANQPTCTICGGTGAGYEFPLFPRCKDKKFGAICAECDHERANEYGLARAGRETR